LVQMERSSTSGSVCANPFVYRTKKYHPPDDRYPFRFERFAVLNLGSFSMG